MRAWRPEQIKQFQMNILGLSQKEFADRLGYSLPRVNSWITGSNGGPSVEARRDLQMMWNKYWEELDCPGHLISCSGLIVKCSERTQMGSL